MTQPAHAIPRYGLYGEALSANAGEIIHCEAIETRSRLYRWEISAHRHPAQWQVLFLASGMAQVTLSGA
ncbi:MAG: AraC family transcriptional regulator, partial [Proteobacteria bacterium]